jgi:hypothetical protein
MGLILAMAEGAGRGPVGLIGGTCVRVGPGAELDAEPDADPDVEVLELAGRLWVRCEPWA